MITSMTILPKNKPLFLTKRKYIDIGPERALEGEVVDEAQEDWLKEQLTEQRRHEDRFDHAVVQSNMVLFACKSVFPFDFFPNEVIIDINKITLIDREFFMSGGIQSIYLKDIYDVEIETGPFFSTLIISNTYFTANKLEVKYLKKKDAVKLREIMLGLICANKVGIDLTKLDKTNLKENLIRLSAPQRSTP